MAKRFRPSGEDSFYGDCLYEMVVPQKHFLRQLRGLLDWDDYARPLLKVYKGEAEVGGVPPEERRPSPVQAGDPRLIGGLSLLPRLPRRGARRFRPRARAPQAG